MKLHCAFILLLLAGLVNVAVSLDRVGGNRLLKADQGAASTLTETVIESNVRRRRKGDAQDKSSMGMVMGMGKAPPTIAPTALPPLPQPVPTIAPAPSPSAAPAPGFPVCEICGPGREVERPNVIFTYPGRPDITCGQLQFAGLNGFISPSFCVLLPASVFQQCGCIPSLPSTPSRTPSSAPQPLPFPTPFPAPPPSNCPIVPIFPRIVIPFLDFELQFTPSPANPIVDVQELHDATVAYLDIIFEAKNPFYGGVICLTEIVNPDDSGGEAVSVTSGPGVTGVTNGGLNGEAGGNTNEGINSLISGEIGEGVSEQVSAVGTRRRRRRSFGDGETVSGPGGIQQRRAQLIAPRSLVCRGEALFFLGTTEDEVNTILMDALSDPVYQGFLNFFMGQSRAPTIDNVVFVTRPPSSSPNQTPKPTPGFPTESPEPSPMPSAERVPSLSVIPSSQPSKFVPTPRPTTSEPTETARPSPSPSLSPTQTMEPSKPQPTNTPTETPVPSPSPSIMPTRILPTRSFAPTTTPTDSPVPTPYPSVVPSVSASPTETTKPTVPPTESPFPTPVPSLSPTKSPFPSFSPSTDAPTQTATPTFLKFAVRLLDFTFFSSTRIVDREALHGALAGYLTTYFALRDPGFVNVEFEDIPVLRRQLQVGDAFSLKCSGQAIYRADSDASMARSLQIEALSDDPLLQAYLDAVLQEKAPKLRDVAFQETPMPSIAPSNVPTITTGPTPSPSKSPTKSRHPSVSHLPTDSPEPSPSPSFISPSNIPSITVMPSISGQPSVSGEPSRSKKPSHSQVPTLSSVPSRSSSPSTSQVPSVSQVPSHSQLPSFSSAPSVSWIPSASQVPSKSQSPSSSQLPSVSFAPSVMPSHSQVPTLSSVPSQSSSPSTSRVPSVSKVPTPTPTKLP